MANNVINNNKKKSVAKVIGTNLECKTFANGVGVVVAEWLLHA